MWLQKAAKLFYVGKDESVILWSAFLNFSLFPYRFTLLLENFGAFLH
jgi:hypothetical protein